MELQAVKLGLGRGRKGVGGVCFQPPDSLFADGLATEPESFFALDVLRQRLHEKIQEARGQVGGGDLWVPGWHACCSGIPTLPGEVTLSSLWGQLMGEASATAPTLQWVLPVSQCSSLYDLGCHSRLGEPQSSGAPAFC